MSESFPANPIERPVEAFRKKKDIVLAFLKEQIRVQNATRASLEGSDKSEDEIRREVAGYDSDIRVLEHALQTIEGMQENSDGAEHASNMRMLEAYLVEDRAQKAAALALES